MRQDEGGGQGCTYRVSAALCITAAPVALFLEDEMSDSLVFLDRDQADLNLLRHALGCRGDKKNWGFRNYFAAALGGANAESFERLVTKGLAHQGQTTEAMQYYHATESGCVAVGLSAKQTKKALE